MKSSNVIRSFALVLAIAAGQFSLQVAHAHAALQQSTPAANAVVASPGQNDLVFNATFIPQASRLKLTMKHCSSTMTIENLTTEIANNGKTLLAKLPVPLVTVDNTVEYCSCGAPKHPIRGTTIETIT